LLAKPNLYIDRRRFIAQRAGNAKIAAVEASSGGVEREI
jgi:hypothetical protein